MKQGTAANKYLILMCVFLQSTQSINLPVSSDHKTGQPRGNANNTTSFTRETSGGPQANRGNSRTVIFFSGEESLTSEPNGESSYATTSFPSEVSGLPQPKEENSSTVTAFSSEVVGLSRTNGEYSYTTIALPREESLPRGESSMPEQNGERSNANTSFSREISGAPQPKEGKSSTVTAFSSEESGESEPYGEYSYTTIALTREESSISEQNDESSNAATSFPREITGAPQPKEGNLSTVTAFSSELSEVSEPNGEYSYTTIVLPRERALRLEPNDESSNAFKSSSREVSRVPYPDKGNSSTIVTFYNGVFGVSEPTRENPREPTTIAFSGEEYGESVTITSSFFREEASLPDPKDEHSNATTSSPREVSSGSQPKDEDSVIVITSYNEVSEVSEPNTKYSYTTIAFSKDEPLPDPNGENSSIGITFSREEALMSEPDGWNSNATTPFSREVTIASATQSSFATEAQTTTSRTMVPNSVSSTIEQPRQHIDHDTGETVKKDEDEPDQLNSMEGNVTQEALPDNPKTNISRSQDAALSLSTIKSQPSTETDGQECHRMNDQGTFIRTNLNNSFSFFINETKAKECLKKAIRERLGSNSSSPCSNLTGDTSFDVGYVQKDDDQILWYPFLYCYNETQCPTVKEVFEKCNESLARGGGRHSENDLRFSFVPSLPWMCPFQYDTRNYSRISVYLHIISETLLKDCEKVLCRNKHSELANITILNLDESTDHKCRDALFTLRPPSCPKDTDAFCFIPLHMPQVQKSIVFITNNTKKMSETEKNVHILHHFSKVDPIQCTHALNYTKHSRIIQNVYQNYYFCYGNSRNTAISDSWTIEEISEEDSLVAVNGNVDATVISSNIMLQALISTKNVISTELYNRLATSGINFKRYISEFNIPVFESKKTDAKVIQEIGAEKTLYTTNDYFTKFIDTRWIWSELNWMIFHNCWSHYREDSKYLFLFLSNKTMNLTSLCSDRNAVLLTSIRREDVSFNNDNRYRGCRDGAIHKDSSEHCQNLIEDASDYETRFFHFLVYPLTLDKETAVEQLGNQVSKVNGMEIFEKNFEANTHPQLLGGYTFLKDPNASRTDINRTSSQSDTLTKTLQIFVIANLTNNTECLDDMKNKRFSIEITRNIAQKPMYKIGPVKSDISNASCLQILPLDIYKDLRRIKEEKRLHVNKFWSMCDYDMLFAWDERVEHPEWDYLDCKGREIALFALCCFITAMTITGNIAVIVIIIASGLIKKHAFMIYTSLSIADLLAGLTSELQALLDTTSLMNGELTIYDLSEDGPLAAFSSIASYQPKGFNQVRFKRDGWPAFTGIALNVSIMSSLMSLAFLGVDRLLMLKRRSFNDQHIRFGIIITWVWNIICALLINIRNDEDVWFVGFFDPITKLTLNIANANTLSLMVFKIQLFIGSIAGIIIITASISSLAIYRFRELRTSQREMNVHDQKRGEKIHVVTRTFLTMVILFLLSCGPIGYSIIARSLFESENDITNFDPKFQFFTWWLCMAGCSWNWLIYCCRGTYFRKEAVNLWNHFWGKPTDTSPPAPKDRKPKAADRIQLKTKSPTATSPADKKNDFGLNNYGFEDDSEDMA